MEVVWGSVTGWRWYGVVVGLWWNGVADGGDTG